MPLRVSFTRHIRLKTVSIVVSIKTVVTNRNNTPITVKLLDFSVKALSALSNAIVLLGKKLL
ncbi:Uncharacterised protein [Acinetobacter baumannii]|nr:Uncharacterised protein [Acinetobacter baumannii]